MDEDTTSSVNMDGSAVVKKQFAPSQLQQKLQMNIMKKSAMTSTASTTSTSTATATAAAAAAATETETETGEESKRGDMDVDEKAVDMSAEEIAVEEESIADDMSADDVAALLTQGKNGVTRLLPMEEMSSFDFKWCDADTLAVEISEFFSYEENSEFSAVVDRFCIDMDAFLTTYNTLAGNACNVKETYNKRTYWSKSSVETRRLELVSVFARRYAAQSLLYVLLGCFCECRSVDEQLEMITQNVLLVFECGAYPILAQHFIVCTRLLMQKLDVLLKEETSSTTECMHIGTSIDVRLSLALIYIVVEVMRRAPESIAHDFSEELMQTVGDNPLEVHILRALSSPSASYFPSKKLVLLLWKVFLAGLGDTRELNRLHDEARKEFGLPEHRNSERHKVTHDELASAEAQIYSKFYGYFPSGQTTSSDSLPTNNNDVLLPPPIRESLAVMESNLFVSLADHQARFQTLAGSEGRRIASERAATARAEEENMKSTTTMWRSLRNSRDLTKLNPYVSSENPQSNNLDGTDSVDNKDTHTDLLYAALVPEMPTFVLSMLTVMLASMTDQCKFHITCETTAAPPSDESPKCSNSSAAPSNNNIFGVSPELLHQLDIERHKEIILKGVVGALFILIRHLKTNHIYQFEYMAQLLSDANCIPLVLKYLNQNLITVVSALNSIADAELLPFLVRYFGISSSNEKFDISPAGSEASTIAKLHDEVSEKDEVPGSGPAGDYCWRNFFSIVTLLRLLQKLTKNKPTRILALIEFKGLVILKRASSKIDNSALQTYVLKLIQSQTKYLGRGWRRGYMRAMSSMYRTLRRGLLDHWICPNNPTESTILHTAARAFWYRVEAFNRCNYPSIGGPAGNETDVEEKMDVNDVTSVLFRETLDTQLPDNFFKSYRYWLLCDVSALDAAP